MLPLLPQPARWLGLDHTRDESKYRSDRWSKFPQASLREGKRQQAARTPKLRSVYHLRDGPASGYVKKSESPAALSTGLPLSVKVDGRLPQNCNRKVNSMRRMVVELALRYVPCKVVIRPAVASSMFVSGSPKGAWFKAL